MYVPGEGEQGARPGREPGRDARLQLPAPAGDAAEGQARRGRGGHRQEAAAACRPTSSRQSVVKLDGQARQAMAAGREDLARTALERKMLVQEQLQGLDQQIAGARGAAAAAGRPAAGDVREGRGLPHPEGGHQGAVLGGRGPGADRRGDDRPVQRAVGHRRRDRARAGQDRAAAGAGVRGRGAGRDRRAGRPELRRASSDLDRQIAALSADTQVESEMAKASKAEVARPGGTGGGAVVRAGGAGGGAAPSSPPPSASPSRR